MRGSTQASDDAQYPIAVARFTAWAKQRGADISEEDGQIAARWGEQTHITMGDERIECWKPYGGRSVLEIREVSPDEERLSMTSAGRGELRDVRLAGDRLEIDSTHMGTPHEYVVEVNS